MPPSLLQGYCEGGEAQKGAAAAPPSELRARPKAEKADAMPGATAALLSVVETALAAVTVSAPDYETLEFFWTLRRLIKTGTGPMSLSQQATFARRRRGAPLPSFPSSRPRLSDSGQLRATLRRGAHPRGRRGGAADRRRRRLA